MTITHNIIRIEDNESILCWFHRIYVCKKTLLDYTNLFYPNDYRKNNKKNISVF